MKELIIDGEVYNAETGELINKVEQVEVEIIEDSLPAIICDGGTHIKTNSQQLKKELIKHLEKYDVEVTEDTEKDCSKMATELNKLSKDLDTKRKAVASEIKKPADALKVEIDSLIQMIQDKRTQILDGVSVFKQKRMDLVRALLNAKIKELYETMKVSEKYQVCNIEPLVLEGSLGKSQLTKSALESLEAIVNKVKRLEDTVTIREMQLLLKSNEAGLSVPIELDEVQNIIEDDNYDALLNDMIQKRLEIQEKLKLQLEEQEREKERLAKELEAKKYDEEKKVQIQALKEKIEKQEETGKKTVKLVAYFDVEVPVNVKDNEVWSKYAVKLQKEFSTFKNLIIEE